MLPIIANQRHQCLSAVRFLPFPAMMAITAIDLSSGTAFAQD
jgi:hypothetical protein